MRRLLYAVLLCAALPLSATNYYVGPTATGAGTCLAAVDRCQVNTVWTKFPTAGDTIFFAGVDFKTDGLYQGANNMIQPPHPSYPTVAVVAGGGTMTAGKKTFLYTQTCGGVEQGVSVWQSTYAQLSFAANDRVTLGGIATGGCVGGGTRTKATIYATKDETLGAATNSGLLYKVGAGCQTPFNDAVTPGATCDPGPDSGWTALPATLPFAGAAGNPLTIKATNRYGVLIDGQSANNPLIHQRGNSYITTDGIRFANSSPTPFTCVVCNNSGAYNNTFQYVIAWGAPLKYNGAVFAYNDNQNFGVEQNLVYDHVAGFGSGRKLLAGIGVNGPVTITNSIFVYGGSQNVGPKMDVSLFYNSFRVQVRDSVAFWNPEAIPSAYTLWNNNCQWSASSGGSNCPSPPGTCQQATLCGQAYAAYNMDQQYGMFTGDRNDYSTQVQATGYGLIAIMRPADHGTFQSGLYFVNKGGITLKDSVSVDSGGIEISPTYLGGCSTCTAPKNLVATNITEIGPKTGVLSPSDWTATNAVIHLANNSTFTYDGSTGTSRANVCVTHDSSGTVTTTKRFGNADDIALNDALYAAMSYAGYTPIDAKAEVAIALGTIPAACDASLGGSTPTPSLTPTNTPTPSQTPTPSRTPTLTPTVTGVLTATPTPSGCLYWHPATVMGPGYYAYEPCGQVWSHLHPTPTPIP